MLLTLADYDFTYEIKDNQLYIDFVNESAHDQPMSLVSKAIPSSSSAAKEQSAALMS